MKKTDWEKLLFGGETSPPDGSIVNAQLARPHGRAPGPLGPIAGSACRPRSAGSWGQRARVRIGAAPSGRLQAVARPSLVRSEIRSRSNEF